MTCPLAVRATQRCSSSSRTNGPSRSRRWLFRLSRLPRLPRRISGYVLFLGFPCSSQHLPLCLIGLRLGNIHSFISFSLIFFNSERASKRVNLSDTGQIFFFSFFFLWISYLRQEMIPLCFCSGDKNWCDIASGKRLKRSFNHLLYISSYWKLSIFCVSFGARVMILVLNVNAVYDFESVYVVLFSLIIADLMVGCGR